MKAKFLNDEDRAELFGLSYRKSEAWKAVEGVDSTDVDGFVASMQSYYQSSIELCEFFARKLPDVKKIEHFEELYQEFQKTFSEHTLLGRIGDALENLVSKFKQVIEDLRLRTRHALRQL